MNLKLDIFAHDIPRAHLKSETVKKKCDLHS